MLLPGIWYVRKIKIKKELVLDFFAIDPILGLSLRASQTVFVVEVLEFMHPRMSHTHGFSVRLTLVKIWPNNSCVNAGYNFDFLRLYVKCRGSIEDKIMIRSFQ